MWGVVIPMAEWRNGAKSGRKRGDKASLLFPYPEDKCFEILGRTHSSQPSQTQLPYRKASYLELRMGGWKKQGLVSKGSEYHKVRAVVPFPTAERAAK